MLRPSAFFPRHCEEQRAPVQTQPHPAPSFGLLFSTVFPITSKPTRVCVFVGSLRLPRCDQGRRPTAVLMPVKGGGPAHAPGEEPRRGFVSLGCRRPVDQTESFRMPPFLRCLACVCSKTLLYKVIVHKCERLEFASIQVTQPGVTGDKIDGFRLISFLFAD